MRKHPILFCGAMVRAILAGRKTQTRRVIKNVWYVCGHENEEVWSKQEQEIKCPYGQPGDCLWVKESCWIDRQPISALGCLRAFFSDSDEVRLQNGEQHGHSPAGPLPADYMKLNPSLKLRTGRFMPRWASRLTLDIVQVHVERLQEIQEADAIHEGLTVQVRELGALDQFKSTWDALNAKRG